MEVYVSAHKIWTDHVSDMFEEGLSVGLKSEDWNTGAHFLGIWEGKWTLTVCWVFFAEPDARGNAKRPTTFFFIYVSLFVFLIV
jgi:hypothetical protein